MVRPGPGNEGVWQLAQPTAAKVVAPAEEVQLASGTAGSKVAMKVSTVWSGRASISGLRKLAPQAVTSSSGTSGFGHPHLVGEGVAHELDQRRELGPSSRTFTAAHRRGTFSFPCTSAGSAACAARMSGVWTKSMSAVPRRVIALRFEVTLASGGTPVGRPQKNPKLAIEFARANGPP